MPALEITTFLALIGAVLFFAVVVGGDDDDLV